jgi:hypothetical protein
MGVHHKEVCVMSNENVDFFYEGKIVPNTLKNSIYKMENNNTNSSVFENVMSGLLDDFMNKKNISLIKVEKYNNPKLKNHKTYILTFENEKGEQFKCSYIGQKDSLQHGTTAILASSVIFAFAEYGCKFCKFNNPECEFCERSKIDKIFPPEMKCTIKHNMKEFVKVFGKNSVNSIRDFCEGYYEFMRTQDENAMNQHSQDESISPEIQEVLKIDVKVIKYLIELMTSMLGEYASNNKEIRTIMSGYENVEKTLMATISHLQKYCMVLNMIKENPNSVPEEIIETLGETRNLDDNVNEEEQEDWSWEKESENEDEA